VNTSTSQSEQVCSSLRKVVNLSKVIQLSKFFNSPSFSTLQVFQLSKFFNSQRLFFNSKESKMEIAMKQKPEVDYVSELYHRGIDHVLERIFIGLNKKSANACTNASSEWKEIVSYFFDYKIPKFRRILDGKVSQQWKKNAPLIVSTKFRDLGRLFSECLYPLTMTADGKNVAVGGLNDVDVEIRIHNANDLSLVKIIHVARNPDTHALTIKVSFLNIFFFMYDSKYPIQ
jgi:hypothetical protein